MSKGMKAPEKFDVSASSAAGDRLCASWSDSTHRYHVWLTNNGEPMYSFWGGDKGATIYKNPINRQSRTRGAIKLNLDSHPAIVAALASIPTSAFAEARRKEEEREIQEQDAARKRRIEELADEANRLGFKLVPID